MAAGKTKIYSKSKQNRSNNCIQILLKAIRNYSSFLQRSTYDDAFAAFASIFGDCNYTTFCKKTLNRTISVKLLKRDSPGAIYNDLLRWMGSVKADSCGKRVRGVSQMWMSALKKNDFHFFIFFLLLFWNTFYPIKI